MQSNLNNPSSERAGPLVALRQLVHRIRAIGLPYGMMIALNRLFPDFLMRISWIGIYQIELRAASGCRGEAPAPGERGALPVQMCRRLKIRWATPADLPRFADLDFVETARKRLAAGHQAAIALCDQRLVGYVWFARDRYYEDELLTEFRMRHDAIWLHTARVEPQCRRQGIYKRLLDFACSSLCDRGVSRIQLSVERLNRRSVAAHESVGANRIGGCLIFRLLGITTCLGRWTRHVWPGLKFGTRRSGCRLNLA